MESLSCRGIFWVSRLGAVAVATGRLTEAMMRSSHRRDAGIGRRDMPGASARRIQTRGAIRVQ